MGSQAESNYLRVEHHGNVYGTSFWSMGIFHSGPYFRATEGLGSYGGEEEKKPSNLSFTSEHLSLYVLMLRVHFRGRFLP